MPTFERARFLPRAVGSLFAQTVTRWELIVVDDGSRDGTPEAVGPFRSDPRVRYVRLPRNLGLGAAANAGLGLCRGAFVASPAPGRSIRDSATAPSASGSTEGSTSSAARTGSPSRSGSAPRTAPTWTRSASTAVSARRASRPRRIRDPSAVTRR
ncbi:glycosyltransferase family 2 protein [Microtetraspora fusca]|uniref:Glycosyltransferase family 2 protein n=1 Tax=Microtetraspora fusca TaxID=1997 RepID=A0ABW6V094_MICFU